MKVNTINNVVRLDHRVALLTIRSMYFVDQNWALRALSLIIRYVNLSPIDNAWPCCKLKVKMLGDFNFIVWSKLDLIN